MDGLITDVMAIGTQIRATVDTAMTNISIITLGMER